MNLTAEDPAVLWTRYIQLTNIEAAFRSLKSDLGLRPIHHRLERRVEAHIFVASLAYCLQVTLKNSLRNQAPGLSPQAVMEKLATIQMIDVWIPTRDNRWLVMPRYTQPAQEVHILLDKLRMELPKQPPPRIKAPVSTASMPAQPSLSTSPVNSFRFCGGDLRITFTHSIALMRPNTLQVRKSG